MENSQTAKSIYSFNNLSTGMNKKDLLDLMVKNPTEFTQEHFMELVGKKGDEAITFEDLRDNIRRIYDMNEASLHKESDGNHGSLAWFNRRKQKKRYNKFYHRIKADQRFNLNSKTVVAEGDSWFCYPLYVKDINDWLQENKAINLYSMASAGDWMANMIYEGKYIEQLSLIEPDVFLISAGGNDFCGSLRLSYMLNKPEMHINHDTELHIEKLINDRFHAFIWTLKTQYWVLFEGLKASHKFEDMLVITQGYDYALPNPKKVQSWSNPIQAIINLLSNTGNWLSEPLLLKGVSDEATQQAAMRYFIDKVNEMFIELAEFKDADGSYRFPNVFHIDCRNVAERPDDWFDEIHLKSKGYRIIAQAYEEVIFRKQKKNEKVVKAADLRLVAFASMGAI